MAKGWVLSFDLIQTPLNSSILSFNGCCLDSVRFSLPLQTLFGEVFTARSSRGLGHLPFTEETRVRFPYGLQNKSTASLKMGLQIIKLNG